MGKIYDFSRLIDKYSNIVELITEQKGKYEDGKYVSEPSSVTEISAVVIPYTESKVYQSGGTIKKTDRQLYVKTPIPLPLENVKIRYHNKTYSVEEDINYGDYADVYVYQIKWVNNFDKSEEN